MFEVGPAEGYTWKDVLADGLTADVNAHGVEPKEALPLKTTLEYLMQGVELELGQNSYTAWAVKNRIDDQTSYYVRFSDIPGTLLFGPLPDQDDGAQFHILDLV